MEALEFQRAWKLILDDLLRIKKLTAMDLNSSSPYGIELQIHADNLTRAIQRYHDALDACLDGQDPILWKLSYRG